MAPRTVTQLRCGIEEKQSWEWAAAQENLSLSPWLRRLANEEVEKIRAELKASEDAEKGRQRMLQTAFPQSLSDPCDHVQPGAYCYLCSRKNW